LEGVKGREEGREREKNRGRDRTRRCEKKVEGGMKTGGGESKTYEFESIKCFESQKVRKCPTRL
jgi:hypothetical protein